MTAPPPPPGWYSDSTVPGQLRWWDGTHWTENIQAAPPPAGAPAGIGPPGFAAPPPAAAGRVKTITLTGDRAIARVEEGGDPEVWAFQRQGPWKVDNIAKAGG